MSAEIIDFNGGSTVDEDPHLEADDLLDNHKGIGLTQAVLIGIMPDGKVLVCGTDGLAESCWLIERGKHMLVGLASGPFDD